MDFIDLNAQQDRIRPELDRRIKTVLAHGKYIMGPEVHELEEGLAEFVDGTYCVSVSSGTDALLIALLALEVGPGDEVVTTPFSFIATAEAILLAGATPVFVDIDPRTYNLDPHRVEEAISSKTQAIMPVSLYGQPADLQAINGIANRRGLPVIEDAAQSFGAWHHARRSCALSTIGCTSFFPSKPLGAYGDGGACFTADKRLAERMRQIRVHGQERRYHHTEIGLNGRLDTLQAAVLLAKFGVFEEEIEQRRVVGARYTQLLAAHEQVGISTPWIAPENTSVYAQYTVQVPNREEVQKALREQGIPTAVHYPVPLYRQPVLGDLAVEGAGFTHTERAAKRVLSLPMHPYLTKAMQEEVVNALAGALTYSSSSPLI